MLPRLDVPTRRGTHAHDDRSRAVSSLAARTTGSSADVRPPWCNANRNAASTSAAVGHRRRRALGGRMEYERHFKFLICAPLVQ